MRRRGRRRGRAPPAEVSLDPPLTFTRAARAIHWPPDADGSFAAAGRRLRRLCLQREAEVRRVFVVRDKRGQPRAVTLGAITRYLPELRPSRVEQLASAVKSHLTELRLQLRRDAQEAAEGAVAGRLQELRERDAKISAEVELLSKVLADFAGERRRP